MIVGAARLSARSAGAEVKALMERRGGGLVRNEGEAECLRVVEAGGTTLTRPYNGATRTGAVLEEFERSERPFWALKFQRRKERGPQLRASRIG